MACWHTGWCHLYQEDIEKEWKIMRIPDSYSFYFSIKTLVITRDSNWQLNIKTFYLFNTNVRISICLTYRMYAFWHYTLLTGLVWPYMTQAGRQKCTKETDCTWCVILCKWFFLLKTKTEWGWIIYLTYTVSSRTIGRFLLYTEDFCIWAQKLNEIIQWI